MQYYFNKHDAENTGIKNYKVVKIASNVDEYFLISILINILSV